MNLLRMTTGEGPAEVFHGGCMFSEIYTKREHAVQGCSPIKYECALSEFTTNSNSRNSRNLVNKSTKIEKHVQTLQDELCFRITEK